MEKLTARRPGAPNGDFWIPALACVVKATNQRRKDVGVHRVEVVAGTPRREFLHVDDLSSAAVFMLRNYSDLDFLNVGTGEDISILELARLVAEIVGYQGAIALDQSKPDGTPRKLLDIARIS